MTFQRLNPSTVSIKAGTSVLQASLDGTLKIGDHSIEGPGEYDIAGIGLHVLDGHVFVVSEAMHICIVWKSDAAIDSQDDASIDILVCLIDSVEKINELVKTHDPRIVILADEATADSVARADGTEIDRQSSYKMSQPALPAESRVAVLLV